MKAKIESWLKRYVPAEVFAIVGALIFGLAADILFHNQILTAISGTCGDNVGYYGTIIFRDLRKRWIEHQKITFPIFTKTVRNIFFEFGVSEFLDSFFVRPFSMYIFPMLFNNIAVGLIVGKFVADTIFYIPTIVAYELRIKFGRD